MGDKGHFFDSSVKKMRSAGSFTSAYLNGWQGETHLQHCHLCVSATQYSKREGKMKRKRWWWRMEVGGGDNQI